MADHKIKLDSGAAALLDALHGAGYAAYAVGGCVRDSLLGLAPHDWDLWIDSGKSSASQRVYSTAP